jgi:hypothetical protein
MSKLARQITPDEIAAYRQAGVVLLRGVLELGTVNALRRCIDEAVNTMAPQTGEDLPRAPIPAGDESGGTFLFEANVGARLREFRRLIIGGAVPEIAANLLGGNQVHLYGDQIFVKEPGAAARTAFHQDASQLEIVGEQACVLWVPVDPATAQTGTMMYWRGSHKSGTLYKPAPSTVPTSNAPIESLPDIENNLDEYDIVHFDVEPGDVIVHHYRTVHGAGGNRSRYQVRRAASLRYCGDDIRVCSRPWAPRQVHHKTNLNEGDPLGGPEFPVAWRRWHGQEAA